MPPIVGVIMGSKNDWPKMKPACETLDELDIEYERRVISAHRTPNQMFKYAEDAAGRGLRVIIAGAGGAAHLPGMVAAKTLLPVIGVPVQSSFMDGLDSLLSIVQMPAGTPVGAVGANSGGATNAALLAARILAAFDPELRVRLSRFTHAKTSEVLDNLDPKEAWEASQPQTGAVS